MWILLTSYKSPFVGAVDSFCIHFVFGFSIESKDAPCVDVFWRLFVFFKVTLLLPFDWISSQKTGVNKH